MLYAIEERTPKLADASVFVAPSASVIGSVFLDVATSVWFNAVMRGDNDQIEVGAESNVQDGAVLHTDAGQPLTIGRRTTIGHGAMLHGCTVGDGALIGIGATVLNRAQIGSHCIIGAGALVTEGVEIPPESLLLGVPARIQRRLSPEELDQLEGHAQHYVAQARRYAGALTPRG